MNKQNGFTAIELVITVACISTLLSGIGLIYVGVHFLAKFW